MKTTVTMRLLGGDSLVANKNSKQPNGKVNGRTMDEAWKEREKRLEELLEKEGENPEAKEDFNRLLR